MVSFTLFVMQLDEGNFGLGEYIFDVVFRLTTSKWICCGSSRYLNHCWDLKIFRIFFS